MTKLGRLVYEKKIKSLEEVFLYDLPILEPEIFDHFLGITIKEEVLTANKTDVSCSLLVAVRLSGLCFDMFPSHVV